MLEEVNHLQDEDCPDYVDQLGPLSSRALSACNSGRPDCLSFSYFNRQHAYSCTQIGGQYKMVVNLCMSSVVLLFFLVTFSWQNDSAKLHKFQPLVFSSPCTSWQLCFFVLE